MHKLKRQKEKKKSISIIFQAYRQTNEFSQLKDFNDVGQLSTMLLFFVRSVSKYFVRFSQSSAAKKIIF